MSTIRRFSSAAGDFEQRLAALLAFEGAQSESVEGAVAQILAAVRRDGDAAVIEYTRRFDHLDVRGMAELQLPGSELQAALKPCPRNSAERCTRRPSG